jgi:hypothetical protein
LTEIIDVGATGQDLFLERVRRMTQQLIFTKDRRQFSLNLGRIGRHN